MCYGKCLILLCLIEIALCCENSELQKDHFHMVQSYMDIGADPCQDFYQYACGNWKNTHINPSLDSLKFAEGKLFDVLKNFLQDINSRENSVSEEKAKQIFQCCIKQNSTKTEKLQTYVDTLRKFGSWPILDNHWTGDDFDWINASGFLRTFGVNALIQESIKPNWKNSSEMIVYLTQPKFKFITRNDLLSPPLRGEEYIFLYKRYIKYLMIDLGCRIRIAKHIADEIVDFESELAKIMVHESEIPIPDPISFSDASEIDWNKYLTVVLGNPVNSSIILAIQENYFERLSNLIKSTKTETVAKYLLFKFFLSFEVGLDEESKIVDVAEKCLKDVTFIMGPVMESIFIRNFQLNKTKQEIENIFTQLKTSFRNILETAEWLDTETRTAAKLKLEKMICKVGSPEELLESTKLDEFYDSLQLNTNNYEEMLLNFAQFKIKQIHQQLNSNPGGLARLLEINPLKINAYYKLTENSLIIPVGLLQIPFYNKCLPIAWIFGSLGSMLGHELLHGFDLEGHNYNALGNIENWWSVKSLIAYFTHADCLIEQHNNYTVSNVTGLRTLSENIADNGGVKLSYQTYYRLHSDNLSDSQHNFLNLTNSEIFFLSFAQLFCGGENGSTGISKHTAHKYRVLGALSNFNEFAETFKCTSGSVMNPNKKCKMW